MSLTHVQLYETLDGLAALLRQAARASFDLSPALAFLGAAFDANGGMIVKAEDPTTLRLAAQFGEILDEDALPGEFLDLTYTQVFRYRRAALVTPGMAGYPGSVIGAPLKVGDRSFGGLFLLRGKSQSAFTAADAERLQLLGVAMGTQLESLELARSTSARRAELEAVHASMVDGLVVVDRSGNISSFNEAFKRMSQIQPFELYAHRWAHLVEPRHHPSIDAAETLDAFMEALITGKPYLVTGCPAFLRQPDGTTMAVTIGLATIEESGQITGGTLNIRDATVEAHLDRLKDDFIATVSHELKTPLTSIQGFVELLRNHELPRPEQLPLLDLILDESKRLGRMIRDLLDLSKIQSGLLTLHLEKFQVARLIEQVVTPLSVRYADTHRFVVEVSPPTGTMVADRDRLQQVLINLVGNAIKYSPAGGTVHVRVAKVRSMWEFHVTDEGIGIPEEALPRLFGRFFRVNEQQSTGSGLGLFITKNLVERHGGRIQVTSREGEGSTFTVVLPARPAEAK